MNIQLDEIEGLIKRLINALVQVEAKQNQGYLCTKQAATYLGVSPEFLEHARYQGGGPRYIKLSQAVRYKKSDLDEFMASRMQRHTAEA